ncbi:MAG: 7-cyano-7-deazaguanine synthase QueC [Nitrospirae bacterium]|nr:7-cyano-7-deazaguanine synthase QueC [Nitrospirota bacterium]
MRRAKNPGKAVVLLSGGLDSATTLAIAKEKGHELYAVTFDYQQRHARELESARSIASALAVKKHLIVDFSLRNIGGSALTSDLTVPKNRNALSVMRNKSKKAISQKTAESRITNHESPIPATYVPARNTIFLSFALAWAEVLGAGAIFIGANAVDYSGYPDCRPEYLKAFEKMANLATKASVEGSFHFHVIAPLIFMTKAEIIQKGIALGIDYGLTWSCYDPQPAITQRTTGNGQRVKKEFADHASQHIAHNNLYPCGKCDSCRLREKGFREAGLKDPLISQQL